MRLADAEDDRRQPTHPVGHRRRQPRCERPPARSCAPTSKADNEVRFFDPDTSTSCPPPRLPEGSVADADFHPRLPWLAITYESSSAPSTIARRRPGERRRRSAGRRPTRRRGSTRPRSASSRSSAGRASTAARSPACSARRRRASPASGRCSSTSTAGPRARRSFGFLGRYNYFVEELGIAVIRPNVRGSAGFGKTFLSLDDGIKREDSVKDIGALLDWIARQPDLDACAGDGRRGGSYGGYMSLAVATHYADRIAGSIDVVGISNFVSFLEHTESYRRDLRRVEYGDERDPAMRDFLLRISPLTNAARITKPLFVVQGRNDPRVPYTEAEQIVAKVRANGTPRLVPARGERGARLRPQGERRLPVLRDRAVHARDAAQGSHGRRGHPRPRRGDGRVQPDRRAPAGGSTCRASAATPRTSPSPRRDRARGPATSPRSATTSTARCCARCGARKVSTTAACAATATPSPPSTSSPTTRRAITSASSAAARRRAGSPPSSSRMTGSRRRACSISPASRWRSRRRRARPASPRSRRRARPASRSRSTPTTAPKLWPLELARSDDRRGDRRVRHLPAELRRPRAPDRARFARGDGRALPRASARASSRSSTARTAPGWPRASGASASRRIRARRSTRPAPAMRSAAPSSPASSPATISSAPAPMRRRRRRSPTEGYGAVAPIPHAARVREALGAG